MDKQIHSLLTVVIIPGVIKKIVEEEGISEEEAIKEFYNSQTYSFLGDDFIKLWHYSIPMIYQIYKLEKEKHYVMIPEAMYE